MTSEMTLLNLGSRKSQTLPKYFDAFSDCSCYQNIGIRLNTTHSLYFKLDNLMIRYSFRYDFLVLYEFFQVFWWVVPCFPDMVDPSTPLLLMLLQRRHHALKSCNNLSAGTFGNVGNIWRSCSLMSWFLVFSFYVVYYTKYVKFFRNS